MAQLTLILFGRIVKVYELDRDRITIGRRPTNDIHIDNLAVSGSHAVIHRTEEGYVIEDVGSTNGTLVNEESIQRHVLRTSDLIKIGKHELIYNESSPKKSTIEISVTTKTEFTDTFHGNSSEVTSHNLTDNFNLPKAAIRILNGSRRGTELHLDHNRTNLGRPGGPSAVITRSQRGYLVNATESTDRVLINDLPVNANHILENRDVIEIAGFQVEFYYVIN